MKNLALIFIVLFAFAFSAIAQTGHIPIVESQKHIDKLEGKEVGIDVFRKHFRANQSKDQQALGWAIPTWSILENYYGSYDQVNSYANIIFPDSSVLYESGGNFTHAWMHSFGGVFDPYVQIFDPSLDDPLVESGTPYIIDSLFFYAWYNKFVPTEDTLIIEIVRGLPETAPVYRSGISFTANNFPVSPPYLESSQALYGPEAKLTAPNKEVIKYVLTDDDSTMAGAKEFLIPVDISVAANEIVGVNVTYVPGTQYTFGDTLFSYSGGIIANPIMNAFRVGFYGVDNPTNFPLYFADDPLFFGYNLSHYVPVNTRYQLYTGNVAFLNEIMYPSANWGFHLGYHVSISIGMDNKVPDNIVTLSQNQPNPFNDYTTIKYTLSEAADVNFELFDQTGRRVMSINRGVEGPGQHTLELDGSRLQNGIYFYTLTAGNFKASKKMVVVK